MKKSDNTNFSSSPRRHATQGSQPDLLELGQAVRQARVDMGLTQAQLSLVTGTSRDTIIALENGRGGVSLGNALQVLKGLGLTLGPKERG
ncbi:MAG TPA: helix-turn-helix domain-containing protein [Luteimonas sp.]|nr:helix-turn-helix domain-containing protein [Luteimonas sp.]